jgi:alkanesulfonate monooxygenase SsuD/methylene tetrahydromethanopterin reductase-like flavin-dependent oxidoreductase (luciferase family)
VDIGIGLPASVPGTPAQTLLEWGRQADTGPFSSLGIIDRVVFDNYEPLATLSAVAAVTERVRLVTSVLLAPLRDTVLLAKQAATIDRISNGRLTLGFGVGGRDTDFIAANRPFHRRGRRLDEQLRDLKRIWAGGEINGTGPVGPAPVQPGGPEILIGGYTDRMVERIVRWADGFISGTAAPEQIAEGVTKVRNAWHTAGRDGKPRFVGCFFFALGEDVRLQAEAYLLGYYGPERGALLMQNLPTTPEAVLARVGQYRDLGADEVICWTATHEINQVRRLAETIA